MIQSKELTEFYIALQEWLDHGADSVSFHREYGLCDNLAVYHGIYAKVIDEMKEQFTSENLHRVYPFNEDSTEFDEECETSTCYKNPKRLQWIKDHLPKE